MPPELRLATIADIPALRELIRTSVSVLSEQYYSQAQIWNALTHVFGVDTTLILDGTYFLVAEGDRIAGCGGWSKRQTLFGGDQIRPAETKTTDSDDLLNPATEAARIRAFYVHPEYARRGIGSMILRACEAAAMAEGFARVELIATLPGQPLYSSLGYTTLGPFEIPLPSAPALDAFRMGKSLMPYRIRELVPADQPLLWEMLFQSLYVPQGMPPFERNILNQPAIANYVTDWGRDGDAGFVAVDADNMPIAAIWLRMLGGDIKGFGYVDEQTPELGMAVVQEWRKRGVGMCLLTRMIESASRTHEQICLSVNAGNPALRLYQRLGFEALCESGGSITMKLKLTRR
ncbi:MAG TPA: GNAT family N-acetyltransferase [Pyrinomonadaceae bacterium]|nr:GNAT family N-acetyltransferase [Pyrinomonadaceae bacterium]